MTTGAICPDPFILSQFLDRELGPKEEHQIHQHLEACPECRARVRQMRQAEERAWTESIRPASQPSGRTSSPQCLSPEVVSAYVQRMLNPEVGETVDRPLYTCDALR